MTNGATSSPSGSARHVSPGAISIGVVSGYAGLSSGLTGLFALLAGFMAIVAITLAAVRRHIPRMVAGPAGAGQYARARV